ncbi:MAG: ferredoxin reductase [Alphaproteobacteria bacterium]|nr:ferredoxin reductase [Alphaproteobacteria bacterium]
MPETDERGGGGPRLLWRTAQVREAIDETPRVRSLVLDVPGWTPHRPGQHVDVRLTAEDGYQAQRSYSIASPPEARHLVITVERIDDGEVSPYLASEARAGDRFEIRGPIGGYFVWTEALGGPLFLIAGGSGIAPLMAMLRHRAARASKVPALLLNSARSVEDIIYREELERLASRDDGLEVVHTLTRRRPAGWTGGTRRIDRDMLAELGIPATERPRVYICGPTPLVEEAAKSLVALGHDASLIKTERFGPTGATHGS